VNRRALHSRHDVITLTTPGTYLVVVRAITTTGLGASSERRVVIAKAKTKAKG
jgi:hypothetical protein